MLGLRFEEAVGDYLTEEERDVLEYAKIGDRYGSDEELNRYLQLARKRLPKALEELAKAKSGADEMAKKAWDTYNANVLGGKPVRKVRKVPELAKTGFSPRDDSPIVTVEALCAMLDGSLTEAGAMQAAIDLDGQIFTGPAHFLCWTDAAEMMGMREEEIFNMFHASGEQLNWREGFTTQDGTFLTREEAAVEYKNTLPDANLGPDDVHGKPGERDWLDSNDLNSEEYEMITASFATYDFLASLLEKWTPALLTSTGNVYTGRWHPEAYDKAAEAEPGIWPEERGTKPEVTFQDGFVDEDGRFLDREGMEVETGTHGETFAQQIAGNVEAPHAMDHTGLITFENEVGAQSFMEDDWVWTHGVEDVSISRIPDEPRVMFAVPDEDYADLITVAKRHGGYIPGMDRADVSESVAPVIDALVAKGWEYDGVQKGLDGSPFCYNFTRRGEGHGGTMGIMVDWDVEQAIAHADSVDQRFALGESVTPAIRTADGRVATGPIHALAWAEFDDGLTPEGFEALVTGGEEGFVDDDTGEFLDRREANWRLNSSNQELDSIDVTGYRAFDDAMMEIDTDSDDAASRAFAITSDRPYKPPVQGESAAAGSKMNATGHLGLGRNGPQGASGGGGGGGGAVGDAGMVKEPLPDDELSAIFGLNPEEMDQEPGDAPM